MGVEIPGWPESGRVRGISTTRDGGCSKAPYDSFNTALHVGDYSLDVRANRDLLSANIGYAIQWLDQVHGTNVIEIDEVTEKVLTADALITSVPGVVCAVQTADCLPILLCDRNGTQVAAVHAGWRGLSARIISSAVSKFNSAPNQLRAWLGPAISQPSFEVGEEVRDTFIGWAERLDLSAKTMQTAFLPSALGKYQADLYALARLELTQLGVREIFGGDACTLRDADKYFSFRRDGITGRMTTAIWIEPAR